MWSWIWLSPFWMWTIWSFSKAFIVLIFFLYCFLSNAFISWLNLVLLGHLLSVFGGTCSRVRFRLIWVSSGPWPSNCRLSSNTVSSSCMSGIGLRRGYLSNTPYCSRWWVESIPLWASHWTHSSFTSCVIFISRRFVSIQIFTIWLLLWFNSSDWWITPTFSTRTIA